MPEATLKINDKYRKLLPSLSPAEYQALKNSIRENGLYVPITANPEGFMLDGHNRYEICIELGVEPKYEVKTFEDALLEKKYVIESNLTRRHLTTFQRIEMALPLIEIERNLAKKRKQAGKPLKDLVQNFGQGGRTLEIVADRIGVSDELLRQALYVMAHASEEDLAKLRSGGRAISSLYKEVKRSMEKKAENHMERRFTGFLAEVLKSAQSIRESAMQIRRYGNTRHSMITAESGLLEEWDKESREFAKHMGLDEEKAPNTLLESTLRKTLEKMKKANHSYITSFHRCSER